MPDANTVGGQSTPAPPAPGPFSPGRPPHGGYVPQGIRKLRKSFAPPGRRAEPRGLIAVLDGGPLSENRRVDLARFGWLATLLACLVTVLVLLVQGYYGYAGVAFAVALSAAINLL